jgi:hypothetical protein
VEGEGVARRVEGRGGLGVDAQLVQDVLAHRVATARVELRDGLLALRVVDPDELGEDGGGGLFFREVYREVFYCVP